MIRDYYRLTKPGIVWANVMTAAAAYLYTASSALELWPFVVTMLAIAALIAGSCILNNYLDRGIDARMKRTQKRALVTGQIAAKHALWYAAALLAFGFVGLWFSSNPTTVALGVAAVVSYVGIYTWSKRHTWHGTLIGSIPGALPPVAGYAAVTGWLDTTSLMMFLVMVCWQMPHFYAIAIFRKKDYASAGLPVLPLVKNMQTTKLIILGYMFLYAVAVVYFAGYSSTARLTYGAVMAIVILYWLVQGVMGLRVTDDEQWAKRIFRTSLIALLTWSLLLAFMDLPSRL